LGFREARCRTKAEAPSYLLRVEEEDEEREYLAFVADLRLARPFAR
jgi:heat shock protein HspQ